MGVLLVVIGFILLVGILALWRGFALSYLWEWFIVPLGVASIEVWHAAGISLLVAFLTYQYRGNEEGSDALLYSFLMPFLALVFGYIYKTLM